MELLPWQTWHGTEPTDISSQKMRCVQLCSVDFETCHKCWALCEETCSAGPFVGYLSDRSPCLYPVQTVTI